MISKDDLAGLILAGGRSTRMQSPKAWVPLHGKPLVHWVHAWLADRVAQVYVSANQDAQAFQPYGTVVADDPEYAGQGGPLAGVASVLAQLQQNWLLVLPVDVPYLPSNLLDRLSKAALQCNAPVAYVTSPSGDHPLCMLVRRDQHAALHAYLFSGQRKVSGWQQAQGAVAVPYDNSDQSLFFNVNTPADRDRAQTLPPPAS